MVAIPVTRHISIDEGEIEESYTRARGPGGQAVNTTDSAVMLRFDVFGSPSLPGVVKERVAELAGSRLTTEGVLVLRSEGARSQLLNRQEVRERLLALLREAAIIPAKRRATRPTKASKVRRVEGKARRSAVKEGRRRPVE